MRYFSILTILFCCRLSAQMEPDGYDRVLQRGELLAKLELASAMSSDFFRSSLDPRKDSVGGHVAYLSGERVTSIYYANSDPSLIYHTYSFDKNVDFGSMRVDTHQRAATAREQELIALRRASLKAIVSDSTNFYSAYKFTVLHHIPLIDSAMRVVYIRTVSTREQFTIFGNDYRLTFDSTNALIKREKLHQTLMPIESSPKSAGSRPDTVVTHHSHSILSSDLPTETDVCTLIVTAGHVPWQQHAVLTPTWNCVWNTPEKNFRFFKKDVK
ncbi:MAG: hypothetical protein JSS89_09390 [Bacteroidetes bacterium]|nr:hypothetical protein [Bacteroidota bacterium]